MKSILSLLLSFSLLTLWLAPVTFSVGCKSANTTAYRATGAAVVTVDKAMTAWGEYVAKFHPPVEQEQRVKDAFEKYQTAASAVAKAGAEHAKLANDPNREPGAKITLDETIAAAGAALEQLTFLIQRFGAKL